MTTTLSYYKIIGVADDANIDTIKKAIANLRQKDKKGSYTATLKKIEQTLTDPDARVVYDIELAGGKNAKKSSGESGFVDVTNGNAGQVYNTQATAILNKRMNNKITSNDIKFPITLASLIKKSLLAMALLGVCGIAFSGYMRWQIQEQGTAAVKQMELAQKEAEEYIRQNGYFPESLSSSVSQGEFYNLRMDKENIVLTFDGNAAQPIQGTELILKSRYTPQIGLIWQCDPGEGFPEEYLPAICY